VRSGNILRYNANPELDQMRMTRFPPIAALLLPQASGTPAGMNKCLTLPQCGPRKGRA
jgi:hypothetical protein